MGDISCQMSIDIKFPHIFSLRYMDFKTFKYIPNLSLSKTEYMGKFKVTSSQDAGFAVFCKLS